MPLQAARGLQAPVDLDQLRQQLLAAVTGNDVSAMATACQKVNDAGLSLTEQAFRDPQNNATVLHTALIQEKWDVAKYLIQTTKDDKFLGDVFTVTG